MKISVSSLGPRPLHLESRQAPAALALAAEGVDFPEPVEVSVKVTRMEEDVLTQGQARTTARMACSRCLEEVRVELQGEFEALFVPQGGAYGKRLGRPDFEWGDQRVNFYSELAVDLSDEIAQCLLAEVPMRPLCRPDCAGLCPQCGKNLNEGPCACQPAADGDDVWAPLRKLFPPGDG